MEKEIELIKNGKRIDGRLPEQLRAIEMEVDVISRANGSSRVRFGNTEVAVSVYGPRSLYPAFLQEPESCIFRCRYAMAPFSVEERKSPGPDRRSIEISKVVRLALEPAIFLEDFPRVTIDAFIEVLQADGSTRTTSINAVSLALAAAGIPMRDLVTSCTVGKVDDQLIVDLCGIEDNYSEADVSFAMMPRSRKITLFQMDGRLTAEEIKRLIELATKNCEEIYRLQKSALKRRYEEVAR
jgi:exosome complex component RRP41